MLQSMGSQSDTTERLNHSTRLSPPEEREGDPLLHYWLLFTERGAADVIGKLGAFHRPPFPRGQGRVSAAESAFSTEIWERGKPYKPHRPWAGAVSVRNKCWASLVAPWQRIHLPTQETWLRSLVQEDPTCLGATKPVIQNYWNPRTLEPVVCNRSLRTTARAWPQLAGTKAQHSNK